MAVRLVILDWVGVAADFGARLQPAAPSKTTIRVISGVERATADSSVFDDERAFGTFDFMVIFQEAIRRLRANGCMAIHNGFTRMTA